MTTNCHKLPCAHCGSVQHERHSYGGLTLCYCVDDEACNARLMKQERERAQKSQENETDDK